MLDVHFFFNVVNMVYRGVLECTIGYCDHSYTQGV